MRRDKDCARADLQGDFQQIAAVKPQNRPAVGMQIPNLLQPVRERVGRFKIRQQNHIVDLSRFPVLFVDGADLRAQ